MAKRTDVTLTASGMPGGIPIGCTITYQVGSIPTASVDLAPEKGGFGNVDSMKRQDASIDIKVRTYTSSQGRVNRKLKFEGLLDGMSLVNAVGSNSYQAIIKNKAQRLLELTTLTPGLYPAGINIYRNANFGIVGDGQAGDGRVKTWLPLTRGMDQNVSSVEFYTKLLIKVLEKQKSGWLTFLGNEKVIDKSTPFGKIFNDDRYIKNISEGIKLLDSIDKSAVSKGKIADLKMTPLTVVSGLANQWKSAPNILLENYMHFLSSIGCTLIFSNSKIFIVPENSVIKRSASSPAKGALQTSPNAAGPADYVSYNYNDNGYRDVAGVIVVTPAVAGGASIGNLGWEKGAATYYMEEKGLSKASGIYVVDSHPWMCLPTIGPTAADSAKATDRMDKASDPMYNAAKTYDKVMEETQKSQAGKDKERKERVSSYAKDIFKNYAETKFYQVRFGDRQGSITMDFNPNWVPGTGGTLYIRETNSVLSFYVLSVTHRIDTSSPSNGTAVTTVSYCCGRIAQTPIGTSQDSFLGYNEGTETGIQKSFLSDMGVS